MLEEPQAVREVRQWRNKMMESWKGKSWEELQQQLNDRTMQMREEVEMERQHR